MDLVGIDITDHDKGKIIRHITRPVIFHYVLLRELIEDLNLADDRQAVGMPLVGRPKHEFAHHPIGIVIAHRELTPNHLLLLAVFFRRQSGVHHRVRQSIERDRDTFLSARRSETVRSKDV